jgi:hypothetical protein
LGLVKYLLGRNLEEFPLSLFSQNRQTMSTAKIIYEQYKVLPKRVREELKALIVNEDNQEPPLTLMQEIEESLKQVKLMKEGKIPKRTWADLKKEIQKPQVD